MLEESVSFIPSIWASMNSWFTPTVLFVFLNLMIGTIAITSSLATKKGNNDQQKHQQQEHYGHNNNNNQPQQLARSPSMLQRFKSINFYNYRSHEPNTNFAQTPSVGNNNSHFTSHFSHEHEQQQQQQQEEEEEEEEPQHQPTPQLGRSPSMLQRLKSFNLYNYLSQDSTDTHYSSSNQEQEQEQEREHHHLEPEQDEEEEEEEEREEEEEDRFQDQEQSLEDIYSQLRGRIAAARRTKSDAKPASGETLKKLPKKMKKSASSKSAFNHFKEEDVVDEIEARRPATMKEYGNPKVTQVDDEGVDAKADDFIFKFKQQLKLQRTASIIRYKDMINRGAGK